MSSSVFFRKFGRSCKSEFSGQFIPKSGRRYEKLYLRKFSNKLLAHAIAVEMPIGGGVCILDNESTQLYN